VPGSLDHDLWLCGIGQGGLSGMLAMQSAASAAHSLLQ
jgi:hypothetical protein